MSILYINYVSVFNLLYSQNLTNSEEGFGATICVQSTRLLLFLVGGRVCWIAQYLFFYFPKKKKKKCQRFCFALAAKTINVKIVETYICVIALWNACCCRPAGRTVTLTLTTVSCILSIKENEDRSFWLCCCHFDWPDRITSVQLAQTDLSKHCRGAVEQAGLPGYTLTVSFVRNVHSSSHRSGPQGMSLRCVFGSDMVDFWFHVQTRTRISISKPIS